MGRGIVIVIGFGVMLALASFAAATAATELPLDRGIGQKVANFQLKDVRTDREYSLYGFRGKQAVVVVFTGTDCPVGNLYLPRLAELSKEYAEKGVAFLAVNANAHETVEEVAQHARGADVPFPVLKDAGNRVADQMMVERTCEALVIDGRATLRYRGAIDDQYGVGTRKDAPTRRSLRDALDAVLADKPVAVAATPVVGCLLDRVAPTPTTASQSPRIRAAAPEIVAALKERDAEAPVAVGRVTYAADVAPIVQNRCQSCHRPGQVAPFALLSFDDARKHAAMIREVVEERRMPPWHADPRYGHFANDRSLTPVERATLLAWVEQGMAPGDPAKLPAPRTFPEGWTIGTPDYVIEIPKPYTVAAQGTLDYVRLRVPSGFTEDRWVQAAEAMPDARAVVHHIIVYVDSKDGRRLEERHLCGYAPGDMPSVYPRGVAKRIPAGSDFVFEIHYTPDGTVRTDRSKLGLIFAKETVNRQAYTRGIAQPQFLIPPRAPSHPVESKLTLPRDIVLLSFMPHMHLRGKDFKYTAKFPDGRPDEVLLSVPAYDFGWQSYYTLAEPRKLPKGTQIVCLAHFDNSTGNPANPDPEKAVYWGKQTYEEMMIGYVDYVDDEPATGTPSKPNAKAKASTSTSTTARPNAEMVRALRALGLLPK